jgi:leucine dehydrogenase
MTFHSVSRHDTGMNPLDHPDTDHELVQWRRDPDSGLEAIIAIHDRSLGPAIGGCRILPYASREAALTDVLRLSRGMTYKCAIGGIPYGGGKAVIIADPACDKTTALLHAMGRFVDELGGKYITSFDSGTTLDDVRVMGEVTAHVGGIAEGFGNASQSTAIGVFTCMEESWRHLTGGDLSGARVAIQGMGNVGRRLAMLLSEAGVATKTHVLNVLHRLTDGKATPASPIDAPQALRLAQEPLANVERYDALRDGGLRHAS